MPVADDGRGEPVLGCHRYTGRLSCESLQFISAGHIRQSSRILHTSGQSEEAEVVLLSSSMRYGHLL